MSAVNFLILDGTIILTLGAILIICLFIAEIATNLLPYKYSDKLYKLATYIIYAVGFCVVFAIPVLMTMLWKYIIGLIF